MASRSKVGHDEFEHLQMILMDRIVVVSVRIQYREIVAPLSIARTGLDGAAGGNNSVDFSSDLQTMICNVQLGDGDFSGYWGAEQLPVTKHLKFL